MKGAIIIPAYNEFFRMSLLLPQYRKLTEQYEIILVDDGSTDRTHTIGELLGWHVVRLQRNMGKGNAVRAGVLKALSLHPTPDFIGFSDADLSVSPEQWPKLIEKLKDYDVVVGSRSMPDSVVQRTVFRSLISKMYSKIVHEVLQLGVRDTQCGLKFFRTDVAKAIFSKTLIAERYAFDIEILLRAKLLGFRIKEVGVNWIAKDGSKVNALTPFEMLISLLRIVYAYNGAKPLQYQYNKKTLV